MAENLISISGLTKRYGKIVAVDNISLEVGRGEIFGLLGPNGAGKTSTLLMLTTLIRPSSGTGTVDGHDIAREQDAVRKSIGIVFQDPSSDDILTGYENLKLHGMLYGMPAGLRDKRIREVLELVDLTKRKDDLVKKYSGGMRRRLEIARGLMHHPKVLFLDEPTLGLDPQSREHIWKYVERLSSEEKMTIVITTHYMEEAERLCDRVAIIDNGRIAAIGTPSALKKVIGGDVVTLTAASPNVARARKLAFVKRIVRKGGALSLTVEDAGRHLPSILRAVGRVDSVEVRSPTLEDVFIHYTGKKIREESTEEGGVFQRIIHRRARR